ncbi:OTU domain-containing protein [Stylophora pistillata]|uniref:OTU domain-containing protein n=1 Tax=Stylophora pistillata TaxID=50429 RepID=A0A2B4RJU4_STYPI|nr:OTU domain-containing protein [Stylophora pistillata]
MNSKPPSLTQLKKLKRLDILKNKLTTIPDAIGEMVRLEGLDLSYNQLKVLSPAIKQLKKLKKLSVRGNPFTVEGMRSVMELENKIYRVYSDVPDLLYEEGAKGSKAQLAYKRALKDGCVKVYRGRIILVGQDRAGKTSLKKSLLGLPFDPKEQSTEGIEVDPSKCEIAVDQAVKNWKLTRERKPGLLECSKDVARNVADRRRARRGMKEERKEEEEGVEEDDGSTDVLQNNGNEHSTECKGENMQAEPDVIIDVAQPPDTVKHVHQWLEYAKGNSIKSALLREESYVMMDVWDFAGQHLYYASHPIFFSQRALYILVHNLSKPLDALAEPCLRQGSDDVKLENPNHETNMENLLSWLATVHSVALATDDTDDDAQPKLPYLHSPVFIVGTHADKPVEDITVVKKQIKERISGMEYEKHVVRPLFCIDNTQRPNLIKILMKKIGKQRGKDKAEQEGRVDSINELQNTILEVLRQEPYMGEKIPVRWFLFEKVIEALVAKQIYHRNLKQLEHYARKDCFMEDEKEFDAMISFYHSQGMIIKHRSTVLLKAQWLIDLFKQLITIPSFNKQNPLHAQYWRELEGNGILSMEHVDHVFSNFFGQGIIKEDILDIMEQFGLIAKFSVSPTDVKYFVPAQLKSSPEELCKMKPSSADPCPLYLHFVHGFVPHGLFLQLVSQSIRWCSRTWPTHQPTLYENGAWFIIGKDIHDFVLICNTGFVKVILREKKQSHQVVGQDTAELATVVREFLKDTLQKLSQELPYLRGLEYRLCVACPYCYQVKEEPLRACSDHMKTACTHEDCFHLIDANEGKPAICTRELWDEVRTFCGLEKWFVRRKGQGSWSSNVTARSQCEAAEIISLKVTLLGSEWSSSMGGLSTINRQLAILMAKRTQVDVTLLVPQFACSEEDKRTARSHNVSIREAEKLTGYSDPLDWLSFPPRDLVIDFVLGHGAKLGKQAQVIKKSHSCKWIQVVHTAPEELGMHKNYPRAICKGEEKNSTEVELCKLADAVIAVGPKLTDAFVAQLRSCKSHEDILQLTPGTFCEFSDVEQAPKESKKFKVLTFGRGDPEDFSLKGYDISARAIVELKDRSYHLIFVGAPDGKQEEVATNLLKSGVDKNQLTVRKFVQSKERLKDLFCEVDLCMMPSRTEGFGLTALEALSAGLPILVSGNSGFGEAMCTVPSGKSFVVEGEDPKEWAKAIAGVREKERSDRLHEIQKLKTSYEEMYSWEKQCDILVGKMWDIVHASKRRDTIFRSHEAEDVDTSTEQRTLDSLLTPSSPDRIIQKLQQMQLDATKVKSRTDLLLGLRKIASDKGFRISDNQGSGNCMFYALSEQLEIVKGIKIPPGKLRQTLIQYLRSNPKLPDGTDLFHFVHGHQTWTEYLTHMEQVGAWGDHVILCAAANYYETCICLVSSLPHRNDVIITPHCPVGESKALVLGHIQEVHYVSLQPAQGTAHDITVKRQAIYTVIMLGSDLCRKKKNQPNEEQTVKAYDINSHYRNKGNVIL